MNAPKDALFGGADDPSDDSINDISGLDDYEEESSFLRAAAHVSTPQRGTPLLLREGTWIARRYQLRYRLGSGGFGDVWDVFDRLSAQHVACKLLRPGAGELAARACREVASLRALRLPGIVRLIDEGLEGETPFVIMERAEGRPFPGLPSPCTWSSIEKTVISLCEALGRVHARGLLHRDLKPGNILVDDEGNPTILDFGLSCLSAAKSTRITDDGILVGTPAYLAPEQVLEAPVSTRTDLYALGVLLYHALSGKFPHPTGDIVELLRLKARVRPPPLFAALPNPENVPAPIAALIDSLLAPNPEDRPRSASDIAEVLRGPGSRRSISKLDLVLTTESALGETNLRSLFAGPDRLLHLRTDAARLLFTRTGGEVSRIRQEIDDWTAAGLCRWDGERLAFDRDALDVLDRDATILRSRDGHEQDAIALAEQLATSGRLARAVLVLEEGLRGLRGLSPIPTEQYEALLLAWVEIAMTEGTPQSLDRVLYELCRPGPAIQLGPALQRLVRVALSVNAWTERAAELAESLPRFADRRLEGLRYGVRVLAARRVSLEREEIVLKEFHEWATMSGDRAALSNHARWLGRLRYCQNRFDEAAGLADEAANTALWRSLEIEARLHAASAWMEAFRLDEAYERASLGQSLAAQFRLPLLEARAEWLMRCIAYRTGNADSMGPDMELVDAASQLGSPHIEALISVAEAAFAYRVSEKATTRLLAMRAWKSFSGTGHPIGRLLAGVLLVAAGERLSDETLLMLQTQSLACPVPSVAVQLLALLAASGIDVNASNDELLSLARSVPEELWHRRLDVLSINEALKALQVKAQR